MVKYINAGKFVQSIKIVQGVNDVTLFQKYVIVFRKVTATLHYYLNQNL